MPWAVMRWLLAERMHWTLDYVDGLDMGEVVDGLRVMRGQKLASE